METPCLICLEPAQVDQRVSCSSDDRGAAHSETHIVCKDCFEGGLLEQISSANISTFEKREQRIHCFMPTCANRFTNKDIDDHTSTETRDAFMEAKFEVRLKKLSNEKDRAAEKKIEEVTNKLLALANTGNKKELVENQIRQWVKYIIDYILTFRCGFCEMVVFDWDACMAVRCKHCNHDFCGWCLKDCGRNAHSHVRQCKDNPNPGEVFPIIDPKNPHLKPKDQVWKVKRTRMIAEFVKEQVKQEYVEELCKAVSPYLKDLDIKFPLVEAEKGADINFSDLMEKADQRTNVEWDAKLERHFVHMFNEAMNTPERPLSAYDKSFLRMQLTWLDDKGNKNFANRKEHSLSDDLKIPEGKTRKTYSTTVGNIRIFYQWFNGIIERACYLRGMWKHGILNLMTSNDANIIIYGRQLDDGECFTLRFTSIERYSTQPASQLCITSFLQGRYSKYFDKERQCEVTVDDSLFKGDIRLLPNGWWALHQTDHEFFQKKTIEELLENMVKFTSLLIVKDGVIQQIMTKKDAFAKFFH